MEAAPAIDQAKGVEEARAALDALAEVDLATCDRVGLDAVLTCWQTLRNLTDAFEVRIARRSRQLAARGQCESAAEVLGQRGRRSNREAKAAAEREQVCEAIPSLEQALSEGSVSTGHLDAVATVTTRLSDAERARFQSHAEELVDKAAELSVDTFAWLCRKLAREAQRDEGVSHLENQRRQSSVRRRLDRATGMYHFHLELDPESGSKVSTAFSAQLAAVRKRNRDDPTMTSERMGAVAMVELITGARALERRVPEISVLIDLRTLLAGLHELSVCETSEGAMLPPSTIRRLCCDAKILPVVLNGEGEVLDLGREQRTANRAQRRALRAMYRTCGHPGCDVPFDQCEIHHVVWWERLGRTDIDNLLPLCSRHHHLVHEGGWTLALAPHRVVTLRRPDGTVYFDGVTTDRLPIATVADPEYGDGKRRRRTAA